MDNCLQSTAVGYSTKLVLNDKADAIIGPACLSCKTIQKSFEPKLYI